MWQQSDEHIITHNGNNTMEVLHFFMISVAFMGNGWTPDTVEATKFTTETLQLHQSRQIDLYLSAHLCFEL